ncbi:S49 family peptidase [uncultured Pseudoalteromonas sp.]|uniref:S49 family peptidase n=1 Tax=uncultured Pseudoalteromonas sp. TaxID=114053 RepID=UPI00259139ED|nr:S49 family peptidase [uncultured Pseudoalteromonas sp.]
MFKNPFTKSGPKPTGTLPEVIAQESAKHLRISRFKATAIGLGILLSVGFTLSDKASETIGPHIAIVSLNGAIETGSKETDGWMVSNLIVDAMKDNNVKAIVIEANSAGGSPTDAEHIYKTLMSYRLEDVSKPIYVTIRGMCASACYLIAAGADEIYAQNSSLVGSIGVRMDSWGYEGALSKLGIEKRVFHAGKHKTLLEPSKDVSSVERQFLQNNILDKLHQQFISSVKQGRGERLADNDDIFSGLIWTGEESVELGLIDGVKTPTELEAMIKDRHGVSKYIYHGRQKFKLSNLFSMDAESFTSSIAGSIYSELKNDVKNNANSYSFK